MTGGDAKGEAVWPLRLDWPSRVGEITTTQMFALLLAVTFDLPLIPTSISASMIAVVPDAPATIARAWIGSWAWSWAAGTPSPRSCC